MSGHSKWATTKYRKGAQDKARAKVFAKCIRAIEVAARDGGGDLEANATLRTAYQKARAASVPLDTIEKAIKRGTGDLEGVRYESITYEGYGPGGVAITPDGSYAYVANFSSDSVSIIDTSTDTVVDTVSVRSAPFGVAIT